MIPNAYWDMRYLKIVRTAFSYEDFDILIDVTGVRKLKIEIMGMYAQKNGYGISTGYYPLVCMTNAVIQR